MWVLTSHRSALISCKIFLAPAARPKGWAAHMFLKVMTRCKIWFPPSRTILLLLENSLQSFPENGWSLPRAPSNRRSQSRNYCRAVSADHGHWSLELVATSHGLSWNPSLRSAAKRHLSIDLVNQCNRSAPWHHLQSLPCHFRSTLLLSVVCTKILHSCSDRR